MRKNRANLRNLFPWLSISAARRVIFAGVIIVGLWLVFGYVARAVKNTDYFKVKNVILGKEKVSDDFSYLKGGNIFNIDLNRQAAYLLQAYPDYQKVRMVKVLPDTIFIDFIRRRPLALVKLYRYFCVGEDMVLFAAPPEPGPPELPVILGLDAKIFGPKAGKMYNIPELQTAIRIIKDFNGHRVLRAYKIKTISVFGPRSVSFLFGEDLEVKISTDSLEDKMEILSSLVRQMRKDLGNIKYIDLRFKDPVIKFIQDAK